MNKKLLFLLPAAMLLLTSCSCNVIVGPTTTDEEGGVTTSEDPVTTTTTTEETVDYGTPESPISIEAAYKLARKQLLEKGGDATEQPVYATGYLTKDGTNVGYSEANGNYTVNIRDVNKPTKQLLIYRAIKAASTDFTAYENDLVLVSGYIIKYNESVLEWQTYNNVKATVKSLERGTSNINVTVSKDESGAALGMVEGLPETAENATSVTFTATPSGDYKVGNVKVNGYIIYPNEGVYGFEVMGNMDVNVEFIPANQDVTYYGTLENPISVTALLNILASEVGMTTEGEISSVVFVTGLYDVHEGDEGWSDNYGNYTAHLTDPEDNSKSVDVYRVSKANADEETAMQGDTITVEGIFVNFRGEKPEFGPTNTYPGNVVHFVKHSDITLTLDLDEHISINEELAETYPNGTEINFSVTVEEGFVIASAKANNDFISPNPDGKYIIKLLGNTTITFRTKVDDGLREEHVDFSKQGYSNAQDIELYTGANFSVAFAKNGNSNGPKYYTSGTAIRIYAKNSFTVSSSYKITKIVLTFGSNSGTNAITVDVGSYAEGTWEGEANSAAFTVGGDTGNIRLAALTVTYSILSE